MFFIGYNAFGDNSSYFDTYNVVDTYYRLELKDCIVDEINIDTTSDIDYKTDKTNWTYLTYLLAKFQNDLEAGNINVRGLDIESIKLLRRIKGESEWQDYITWKYDVEKRAYNFIDKYVANAETYQYATVPIAVGGLAGKYNYAEITVDFNDYFLMDKTHTYKLIFDTAYDGVKSRLLSATFLPMGSKYPIVSFNSELDFEEGNFSGLFYIEDICSPNMFDQLKENIKDAKDFRNNYKAFLKNKKPKILKDEGGNIWLCIVNGDLDLDFQGDTNNVVVNMSFPWIEIGDNSKSKDLILNGLLDTLY